MTELAKKVKETIESGSFYLDVNYCHPERVTELELLKAENSVDSYLDRITDRQIQKYTNQANEEPEEEATVRDVIQLIANDNADFSGRETIVIQAVMKN